jgi:hypothetical protein
MHKNRKQNIRKGGGTKKVSGRIYLKKRCKATNTQRDIGGAKGIVIVLCIIIIVTPYKKYQWKTTTIIWRKV